MLDGCLSRSIAAIAASVQPWQKTGGLMQLRQSLPGAQEGFLRAWQRLAAILRVIATRWRSPCSGRRAQCGRTPAGSRRQRWVIRVATSDPACRCASAQSMSWSAHDVCGRLDERVHQLIGRELLDVGFQPPDFAHRRADVDRLQGARVDVATGADQLGLVVGPAGTRRCFHATGTVSGTP